MPLPPVNAVTSPLDPASHAAVAHLWEGLERAFGLQLAFAHPVPHLTWHSAEGYDWKRLRDAMFHVAGDHAPFKVRTGGLGVFVAGQRRVVHLPLVRNDAMNALHRALWHTLDGVGNAVHPLYAPDVWVPHVTLAAAGVTVDNLAPIVAWLADHPFGAEIQISRIELIGRDESGPLRHAFELGRG